MMNENRNRSASSLSGKEEVGTSLKPEDGQWQSYVLGRLQEKLAPEPIRVACMRPPENRKLLIEEYHGKISKEDVSQLLKGKSGRYLVRDSTTTSGSFTLSFNFDGEIKHQTLICSGGAYKTNTGDSVEYKTVHELMVYVLGLGKKMKKMEGGRKKTHQKQHEFENHTYVHPKWCDTCGGFIWGLWSQGLKCEDCGIAIHKNCRAGATDDCKKVVLGQKLSSQSPLVTTKDRKRISAPVDQYPVVKDVRSRSFGKPATDLQLCSYEKECFKFLTTQVPLNYFDRDSPLNNCYCDEHQDVKGSAGLHNWCKFALVRSPRELKKSLRLAYFSVFPGKVKETLDALTSGAIYQRLKSNEFVVLPSLSNIILMESQEVEASPVRTVLEVGVENGSYTTKSAVNDAPGVPQKSSHLEYWAILPGYQIVSIALLVTLKQ